MVAYLKTWIAEAKKARIKCPFGACSKRIHENDIRVVLSSAEEHAGCTVPSDEREKLQVLHDKHVILYALGGSERCRQCPGCLNLYSKLDGCHYVRCANLQCNTWFCYECGQPIKSWQHFTQLECMVGWDDVYKVTYFLRFFITTNPVVLLCMTPSMLITAFFILPWFVCVYFPVLILRGIYRKEHASNGTNDDNAFLLKAIVLSPLLLIAGASLGIGTFFTAIPLAFLCIAALIAKSIPPFTHISTVIELIARFAAVFGISEWRELLRDTREAREQMEVDKEHREMEKSEKRSLDNSEERVAQDDAKARQIRAVGGDQMRQGAIDVTGLACKADDNFELAKAGNFRQMQIAAPTDVKVNKKQVVKVVLKRKAVGKVVAKAI
ncbi:hypothetical protein AAVH_05754 [Aphelenchoides avenae]|nr:hypothetical protein AAVH_05754 [Aphelenchus avenae]